MQCHHGVWRAISFCTTIRGRILIALLIMSTITATLGVYSIVRIKDAGLLVNKTYDQSLMSINYARAAATDFAAMRAAFARQWIASDQVMRATLNAEGKNLREALIDDLAIAAQRSHSPRARQAATNVQNEVIAWIKVSERMLDNTKLDANWAKLDHYARKVDEQIDLLVNYTAGDEFLYRQSALAAVAHNAQLNTAGTLLALLLSALVAWSLARRIVGPVASASNVAELIATGKLDVVIPKGSADELGTLLASMGLMRDNIRKAMEREVAQRRSAQARLVDALEGSQEGAVLVDAEGRISLANPRAANFLGVPAELLEQGTPLVELRPALDGSVDAALVLTRHHVDMAATSEAQLVDGRWLCISHSTTRDGGFIVVCSDISLLKEQEAKLRQTNLCLDVALDNMSQGLCLYDGQGRLSVVNRRFFDIFGLPRGQIRPGITFRDVLELSVASGNHDARTADQLLQEHAELMSSHRVGTHYYDFNNGRTVAAVYNPTRDGGWVATYEDVTERRRVESKIMHMARHDALTNLPNRLLFREEMDAILSRVEALRFSSLISTASKVSMTRWVIRSAMRCFAR